MFTKSIRTENMVLLDTKARIREKNSEKMISLTRYVSSPEFE